MNRMNSSFVFKAIIVIAALVASFASSACNKQSLAAPSSTPPTPGLGNAGPAPAGYSVTSVMAEGQGMLTSPSRVGLPAMLRIRGTAPTSSGSVIVGLMADGEIVVSQGFAAPVQADGTWEKVITINEVPCTTFRDIVTGVVTKKCNDHTDQIGMAPGGNVHPAVAAFVIEFAQQ